MIPLAEINAIANRLKVPAETVEKDYGICWLLHCIAASPLKNNFTFYGGTALKRIYFENHRFSEDIDLISEQELNPRQLSQHLTDSFLIAKKEAGFIFELLPRKTLFDESRAQIFVHYQGYDEIAGASKEIRIDFVGEQEKTGDTQPGPLIKTYSDINSDNIFLAVHTVNTILASKLGLLTDSNRKEPRDIFDIWFLLNHLNQFDFNLERVKEIFKRKYGYAPSFSVLRSHLYHSAYSDRWKTRLKKQIANLPEIKIVLQNIESQFEKLFSNK